MKKSLQSQNICALSGEWVIITKSKTLREKIESRYKQIKEFVFSMRFIIIAVYFAVTLVTLVLMCTYVVGLMKNNLYHNETVNMFEKANIIADAASEQWDFDPSVTGVRLADITNRSLAGTTIRCIVTNKTYTVLHDTNYESGLAGKVYVRDVLKQALDGIQASDVTDDESGYITVSAPIKSNGEVVGGIYLAQNVMSINNTVNSLMDSLIFFCCVTIILISLLSIGLSVAITLPLNQFKQTASEISKGNFKKRITTKGISEFVEVANSMNYMCDELSLIEENRRKFVSDVSHELKTPMASIKLVCDCIKGADYNPEMVKELLGDMSEEVDRLTRIVERLLELTKLDGKKAELNLTECNIKEMLNQVVRNLSEIARENDITIFRDFVDNEYSMLLIDEDKVYESLYNIIDNAIKYSPEGGYIKINAKENENFVVISIEDTGDGIPDSEKEHVFERFYRIDNSRSRETGGTGLGLSIAKEAITMHGGNIEITDGDDKGSIFKIFLPIVSEHTKNNSLSS